MGPYADVSIEPIEVEIKQFLASGRRPEEHPHVQPYHSGIPDGGFDVVCNIEVVSSWSNKDKIGCSACRTDRKFASGGYVLRHENGYLYVVGPICGQSDYKNRRDAAIDAYRVRQRRKELELELSEFVINFQQAKDAFLYHRSCLDSLFHLRSSIKRANPEFVRCMCEAASSGGKLGADFVSLWYVEGAKQVRVNGSEFFHEPWQIQDAFPLFVQAEPLFKHANGIVDDFIDVSVPQLRKQITALQKVEEKYIEIKRLIEVAQGFFEYKNIEKIYKWVGGAKAYLGTRFRLPYRR